MSRSRQMFAWLFPLACFFVFAYPVWRLGSWSLPQTSGFFWLGVVTWIAGTAAMWFSFRRPNKIVRYITVHWMGISFIAMSVTVLAEIPAFLFPEDQSIVAALGLAMCAVLTMTSIGLAHWLRMRRITIQSPKLTKSHRIVQISDVHIGSRQAGFLRRVVDRINQLDADSVAITGDLVDTSAVGIEELNPLREIESPAFFVIGNHERYADLNKVLDIMKELGIPVLRQSALSCGEVQFIGIDDADRVDQVDITLPHVTREQGFFDVLLYHRPVGWPAAAKAGVDLMLAGHTHNGQIWPFNFLVKRQFKRIAGLYQADGSSLYVSSGTGTWGPSMRLGTFNEITQIDLVPTL
ncbi:MAG: metallophosphoesterase [Pseudomonadota bacterium]